MYVFQDPMNIFKKITDLLTDSFSLVMHISDKKYCQCNLKLTNIISNTKLFYQVLLLWISTKFSYFLTISEQYVNYYSLRDVPVDIYGGGGGYGFSLRGENFLPHQTGGVFFFTRQGEGIFFSPDRGRHFFLSKIQETIFFSKAIKAEQCQWGSSQWRIQDLMYCI